MAVTTSVDHVRCRCKANRRPAPCAPPQPCLCFRTAPGSRAVEGTCLKNFGFFLTAHGSGATLGREGFASHEAPDQRVKPRNVALTVAVLLLSPGAPFCTAQEQLPVKAVVFTIRGLAGVADADFNQLLTEAVHLEIENAGYTVVDGWEKLLAAREAAPVHGPRA